MNLAPPLGRSSHHTVPPWALAVSATRLSPSPVPSREPRDPDLANRSKTSSRSPAGTPGPLDGNANAVAVAGTITGLNIPNGATFWIRWIDATVDAGHGLAVDNFTITATAVPEPGSLALVGLAGAAALAPRFRRTKPAAA